MGEIYVITNLITGRRYVGQTKYTTEQRYREHLCESRGTRSKNYLYRSIRKYGEDNFQVKRIIKNVDDKDLDRLEIIWIEKLNTFAPNGYNVTRGGGGVKNYHHTEETKRLVSSYFKGVKLSPERVQAIKDGQKKHKSFEKRSKNPDWRNNISKARIGRFKGKDNPFGGKHHTEATKQRIREANSKKVYMYSLERVLIQEFSSLKDARDYLISNDITQNKSCQTPISKACRGVEQRKTAYGFIWSYEKV